MSCFYSVMILILRLTRLIFFRQVEVSGSECIPPEGRAVIFAGNHPNALVDPALMMMYAGRKVRTMGKSTIFVGPLNAFFRGLGGIPVYRIMDDKPNKTSEAKNGETNPAAGTQAEGGNGTAEANTGDNVGSPITRTAPPSKPPSRNLAAFREVDQVLREGGAFSIFPEGLSHSQSQLLELKFGLAHMALGFLASTERETGVRPELSIVPVGLTYTSPTEFRSCAWIKFGEPISVPGEIVDLYATDDPPLKKQAVRELTDIVAAGIRRYTVTAPDWETVELTILMSSLYRPSPVGGHASRPWMCWCCAVADEYRIPVGSQIYLASILRQESVMMLDDAVMNMQRVKVSEYNTLLKGLDCSDDDIRIHRDLGLFEVVISAIFYLLVICILIPLSVPILILNLPVLILAKIIATVVSAGEKDTIATYTIISSSLLFPIFYGVYTGVLSWIFAYKIPSLMRAVNYLSVGVWIVFFALVIPTLSFITMRMWEEMLFAKQHCFRLYTLFTYKDRLAEACALRNVCHELVQATIVLLGNDELYAEANDAFPDVDMMSRARACQVVIAFAELNEISSSHSHLLSIARAETAHGKDSDQAKSADRDLKEQRESFFSDSTGAKSIVDRTSLNPQEAMQRSLHARRQSMMQKEKASTDGTTKGGRAELEGSGHGREAFREVDSSHVGKNDPRRVVFDLGDTSAAAVEVPSDQPLLERSANGLIGGTSSSLNHDGSNNTSVVNFNDHHRVSGESFLEMDTNEDRKRQDETAARYGVFDRSARRVGSASMSHRGHQRNTSSEAER